MIENDIEKYLVRKVRGSGGLCLKFTSPGTRAVPDRIVIYKKVVYFVELKRPGGKPRTDQVKMMQRFYDQGFLIHILTTKEEVDHFIQAID